MACGGSGRSSSANRWGLERIPGFLGRRLCHHRVVLRGARTHPFSLRDRSERIQVAAEYLVIPIRPNLAYAAPSWTGLRGHCGVAPVCRGGARVVYFGPSFVGSRSSASAELALSFSAAVLGVLLGLTLATAEVLHRTAGARQRCTWSRSGLWSRPFSRTFRPMWHDGRASTGVDPRMAERCDLVAFGTGDRNRRTPSW